jgi:antitoxin HicB
MREALKNKELDYYLNLNYPVTIHTDSDGGFVAEIEELSGCITQADSLDEVYRDIEDAKKVWIIAAYNEGHNIPLPRIAEGYKGKFLVRIPKSLHRSLVKLAKVEGVSLNQLVTSLLTAGLSTDIFESKINTMFITKVKSRSLAIYGSEGDLIDYDKLISMSPIKEGK